MSYPSRLPVRRALLSVSDKTGLPELAAALAAAGAELLSTGGTAQALRAAGHTVTDVAALTGFPEMLGGRVKTLHPAVHGGLLARAGVAEDEAALAAAGIGVIDLLAVNLYPFEQTLASSAGFEATLEEIDIGGPAMLRAAAKNHARVAAVCDAEDYPALIAALSAGGTTAEMRRTLAGKVFARTAAYDAAIAGWLTPEPLPDRLVLAGRRVAALPYGENPHQAAAAYLGGVSRPGPLTARQVQGKPLSFNNIADAEAAFDAVCDLPRGGAACVIVKHGNPCGAALGETPLAAYRAALACDETSAFGGIVAFNCALDAPTAAAIAARFYEVVIAPKIVPEAAALLATKKNLRVLETGAVGDPLAAGLTLRSVAGGFLAQGRDTARPDPASWRIVTQRPPTPAEAGDLVFAALIAKHVKSNAVVFAASGATRGIGAGQMSRLDAADIAVRKATAAFGPDALTGSVAASEAFFPFADGLETIARAGARAVIQPGGSRRDGEVIAAADAAGLAMVFTGTRHFRH